MGQDTELVSQRPRGQNRPGPIFSLDRAVAVDQLLSYQPLSELFPDPQHADPVEEERAIVVRSHLERFRVLQVQQRPIS